MAQPIKQRKSLSRPRDLTCLIGDRARCFFSPFSLSPPVSVRLHHLPLHLLFPPPSSFLILVDSLVEGCRTAVSPIDDVPTRDSAFKFCPFYLLLFNDTVHRASDPSALSLIVLHHYLFPAVYFILILRVSYSAISVRHVISSRASEKCVVTSPPAAWAPGLAIARGLAVVFQLPSIVLADKYLVEPVSRTSPSPVLPVQSQSGNGSRSVGNGPGALPFLRSAGSTSSPVSSATEGVRSIVFDHHG